MEKVPGPDAAAADIVGAGTRLHPPAFGGKYKHKWKARFAQGRRACLHEFMLILEGFDDRQQHDQDHQDRRYLIDDAEEFLSVTVAVEGEVGHPAAHHAVHPR